MAVEMFNYEADRTALRKQLESVVPRYERAMVEASKYQTQAIILRAALWELHAALDEINLRVRGDEAVAVSNLGRVAEAMEHARVLLSEGQASETAREER